MKNANFQARRSSRDAGPPLHWAWQLVQATEQAMSSVAVYGFGTHIS